MLFEPICPISHIGNTGQIGVYRRKLPKGEYGSERNPNRPQNIVLSILTRGIESSLNWDLGEVWCLPSLAYCMLSHALHVFLIEVVR
jgi:hypothetical protein